MKKKLLLTILVALALNLFASGTNDPKAAIYEDIDRWRNIGLIDRLPPVRPYPAQYIISILEKVKEAGSPRDAKVADKYLKFYTSNSLDFKVEHNSYTSFEEYQTISGFGADANLYLSEKVTGALDINAFFLNGVKELTTPPNRNAGIDVLEDNMAVDAFGMSWDVFQSLNINSAFGTDTMWVQTGLMPASFGPLFDNSVVFNPDAAQAAHFNYTWIHEKFTYSYLFSSLVATDNTGENPADGKYMHIRSLDFKFTDFWEFQFFETSVYGGEGIKPIFFLPFNEFFYAAGQGSTNDVNSLIGLSSRFDLPRDFNLKGTLYVDDVNAKELAKLNFDTKLKLAAQFETEWTPKDSIINSIKVNYTAIMPYMYTHVTETPEDADTFSNPGDSWDIRHHALKNYMNYENYTHDGRSIGPYGMEPNSDRVGLNISTKLPKKYKLKFNFELQRHGDSSPEEIDTGGDTHDDGTTPVEPIPANGTIFDPGYGWEEGFLYQNENNFLTQSVIETMFVGEVILVTPSMELPKGALFGEFGYAFVYIDNHKLIDGKEFYGSYLRASVNYSF